MYPGPQLVTLHTPAKLQQSSGKQSKLEHHGVGSNVARVKSLVHTSAGQRGD
eukprot:CAMPEP_0115194686 /NCGR_PEP_ID=MMETSP0270-20121206/14197_1 /TAXON_ID=71861 /ORGANISM="Scrippsiella trochoidea, Strain CCMP3099" /LENGTH=51 /DNA_ID=CAMNT_0002607993 /DNA_START=305 /DNA_END=460 /DNA_ORIENTATION=-